MEEKTVLDDGKVVEWMSETKDTTTNKLKISSEGWESYEPIEETGLIPSGTGTSIKVGIETIVQGFDDLVAGVTAYVDEMLRLDGQTISEEGQTAETGKEPTINELTGDLDKTPIGNGNNGSGGGNNGGGNNNGNNGNNDKPPVKQPLRSPLAEYGEALVPNMIILLDFIGELAVLNGTTVEEILTNTKFKELFDRHIKGYQALIAIIPGELGAAEMQGWLRSIYNGEDIAMIPIEAVDFVRLRLDSIAGKKGITAEELLNNVEYAEELKGATEGYQKLNTFFAMLSKAENNQEVINKIYTGMVPEAYGFKSEDVYAFKDALDKLATENKVDVMDLLTKAEHAEKIKGSLDTLDPSKVLSEIYKDASASTTQTVATNMYVAAQAGTGATNQTVTK